MSSAPLEVRLEAREPDGRLTSGDGIENPKTLKLHPEEQTAALVSELFGPLSANGFRGWVRAFIDREPVTAFFSIFSPDLNVLDTIDATQSLSASVIFPVIAGNGETVVTVANPHPRAALTQFQLIDQAGVVKKEVTRLIPADGRMAIDIGDLFGSGTEASGYVLTYSDLPLAFLELFGQHGRRVAGLNGLPASLSSSILIPQFVVGNSEVRSTLELIGSATPPIPVTATVRSDSGSVVAATVVNLGTGKTRLTGEQLFPGLAGRSITGYLELRQKESFYEWQAAVTFEDAAGSGYGACRDDAETRAGGPPLAAFDRVLLRIAGKRVDGGLCQAVGHSPDCMLRDLCAIQPLVFRDDPRADAEVKSEYRGYV